MNFYHLAKMALINSDVKFKQESVTKLIHYCNIGKDKLEDGFLAQDFDEPSYAKICKIVPPKELPKRRRFNTVEGLAILLHSIVHIEYSAIDLALDATYRFPQMPTQFRKDWLDVANDEIRHFNMLNSLLESLGYRYGDFPVHRGLFDASRHTSEDVLERMAVIPRHYEATGLDVNPQIINKLRPFSKQKEVKDILEVLEIIYLEEIEHVRKGDFWFRYCCKERDLNVSSTFIKILDCYDLRRGNRSNLNVEARQRAGFSCIELKELGASSCKD